MSTIQVVPRAKESRSNAGVDYRPAFESETDQVGEVRVAAKSTGGWHHHGKRTLYGYVVSGRPVLEFGREGKEHVSLSAGDFFQVPPGLIHRDVNPNSEEAIIMIFNIGPGPASYDESEPQKE
ncbi:MAG: cupin domain-containing protein [Thaumarchaeota archaeon]|nr:cupin domain-containing protein [Nitrososphaerota archaeon]